MNKHPGFVSNKSPHAMDQQMDNPYAEAIKRRRKSLAKKKMNVEPDVIDELGNPAPQAEEIDDK